MRTSASVHIFMDEQKPHSTLWLCGFELHMQANSSIQPSMQFAAHGMCNAHAVTCERRVSVL